MNWHQEISTLTERLRLDLFSGVTLSATFLTDIEEIAHAGGTVMLFLLTVLSFAKRLDGFLYERRKREERDRGNEGDRDGLRRDSDN